jgi:predicted dehydrogenase
MTRDERRPLRVGIVGCGNIAGPYARFIAEKPTLALVAATDLDPSRAQALTAAHGGRPVPTIDDVIAESDLVVNLTFQREHARVSRQVLEAGRHVHSEKPLAMSGAEAHDLVDLAERCGVRLSASPFTLMGEAQQTAWKLLREGRIGQVRAVFAEVAWGRIETWHPAPVPFYEVGPLVDVGVYPLSMVTAMLGPVRRVHAVGRVLRPDRVTRDGVPFRIETPDFIVATLELEGGAVLRLTTSFAIGQQAKRHAGIEFHGDDGSVHLGHFFRFDAPVEVAAFGDGNAYEEVPLVRPAPGQMDWARGIVDLAESIVDDRPHRATGDQAAHIVDVLVAAHRSMREERPVEVTSSFPPPAPMPWAE